jgi:hypothetical protein
MKQVLDKHIPKRLAITIMLGGLVIGAIVGYRIFWLKAEPQSRKNPSYVDWIFPTSQPLIKRQPTGAPAVVPPPGPPPR